MNQPTTYDAYRDTYKVQWKEPVTTPPNSYDTLKTSLTVPWNPAKPNPTEGNQ